MFDIPQWHFAYSKPTSLALIKHYPEDFIVEERLGYDLSGEGEHVYLFIEKKGLNTEQVVKALSRHFSKSVRLISYAGLKDKQAVTRQWFSIHCPGEHLEGLDQLKGEGWSVLSHHRHNKKLKKGGLSANRFQLILRELELIEDIETRLAWIKEKGVPNYFGQQRFGHEGKNLLHAKALLLENKPCKDRFLKGIYYSAARSYLFNCILSARVEQQNWNKALAGDVMQLSGSQSIFVIDEPDETIEKRVHEHDISPAVPLWGKGEEKAHAQALAAQSKALEGLEPWLSALEKHDLARSYRALVLMPQDLKWEWQERELHLSFELPAGCFATSVLRELLASRVD